MAFNSRDPCRFVGDFVVTIPMTLLRFRWIAFSCKNQNVPLVAPGWRCASLGVTGVLLRRQICRLLCSPLHDIRIYLLGVWLTKFRWLFSVFNSNFYANVFFTLNQKWPCASIGDFIANVLIRSAGIVRPVGVRVCVLVSLSVRYWLGCDICIVLYCISLQ